MSFNTNKNFSIKLESASENLINSFFASGDFCCLLIMFANSLDPNHDQHLTECPSWSGTKAFDTLIVFLKEFFLKQIDRKQMTKKA